MFLCTDTFSPVCCLFWNIFVSLQYVQKFKKIVQQHPEVPIEVIRIHLQLLHLAVKLPATRFTSNLVHGVYPPHPFWMTFIVLQEKHLKDQWHKKENALPLQINLWNPSPILDPPAKVLKSMKLHFCDSWTQCKQRCCLLPTHTKIGSDPNSDIWHCIVHDVSLPVWIHHVVINEILCCALRVDLCALGARRSPRPVWTEPQSLLFLANNHEKGILWCFQMGPGIPESYLKDVFVLCVLYAFLLFSFFFLTTDLGNIPKCKNSNTGLPESPLPPRLVCDEVFSKDFLRSSLQKREDKELKCTPTSELGPNKIPEMVHGSSVREILPCSRTLLPFTLLHLLPAADALH